MAPKRQPSPSLFSSPISKLQSRELSTEMPGIDVGVWLESGELVAAWSSTAPGIAFESIEEFFKQLLGRLNVAECRVVRFSRPVAARGASIDTAVLRAWDVGDDDDRPIATLVLTATLSKRWEAFVAKALSKRRRGQSPIAQPKDVTTNAPVAVAAPALDPWAPKFVPKRFEHDDFVLTSYPTVISPVSYPERESVSAWRACFENDTETPAFLYRVVSKKGKLPSDGWANALAYAVGRNANVRVAKINLLPRPDALAAFAAWEYKVGVGSSESNGAFWDVQVFPSKKLLSSWTGVEASSWENSFRLRVLADSEREAKIWAASTAFDVYALLSSADAKKFVQNFLLTLGTEVWTRLFYYRDGEAAAPGREPEERIIPIYPAAERLLRLWMPKAAVREWEHVRKRGPWPTYGELLAAHRAAMAALDERISEGAFEFSPSGRETWNKSFRFPSQKEFENRIARLRETHPYQRLLGEQGRVVSELFRTLDVTDLALVLRTAKDRKWRSFVTAQREIEVKAELEFVEAWIGRGELTPERECDAWVQWATKWDDLRLRFSLP